MQATQQEARTCTRGISLVEVMIYAALVPIILVAAFSLVDSGSKLQSTASANMDLAMVVRKCLRRMQDDIISAGKWGEDLSRNGVLDPGEDLNDNLRLDADWLVDASSIRFNRFRGDGTWSLPIRYFLEEDKLKRSVMLDASGNTVTSVIAGGVASFAVTEKNGEVEIELALGKFDRKGRLVTRTGLVRVLIRN